MTIQEALTQADSLRHNSYSQEEKISWLSRLDGKIKRLILDTHEGENAAFGGYDADTPQDTQLLVGRPFEEIYLYWLEAQICYRDGEIADYNSAIAQYNRLYSAFAEDVRKCTMPKSSGSRFLF